MRIGQPHHRARPGAYQWRDPGAAVPARQPYRPEDRQRAVPIGGHCQDPPAAPIPKARRARPDPGRRAGPRSRPSRIVLPQTLAELAELGPAAPHNMPPAAGAMPTRSFQPSGRDLLELRTEYETAPELADLCRSATANSPSTESAYSAGICAGYSQLFTGHSLHSVSIHVRQISGGQGRRPALELRDMAAGGHEKAASSSVPCTTHVSRQDPARPDRRRALAASQALPVRSRGRPSRAVGRQKRP